MISISMVLCPLAINASSLTPDPAMKQVTALKRNAEDRFGGWTGLPANATRAHSCAENTALWRAIRGPSSSY